MILLAISLEFAMVLQNILRKEIGSILIKIPPFKLLLVYFHPEDFNKILRLLLVTVGINELNYLKHLYNLWQSIYSHNVLTVNDIVLDRTTSAIANDDTVSQSVTDEISTE